MLQIKCSNPEEDGFVNVIMGFQSITYMRSDQNTTISNFTQLSERTQNLIDACTNRPWCPLSKSALYEDTAGTVYPSRYGFKLTCIKSIDRDMYNVICWMYSLINPFCIFLFLYYSDKLLSFTLRYIAEFEKGAIEMRFFTVMI